MVERLLDIQQAAAILGIPYRTLQVKYAVWGMPFYRLGKHVRFRESELEAFIQARREA